MKRIFSLFFLILFISINGFTQDQLYKRLIINEEAVNFTELAILGIPLDNISKKDNGIVLELSERDIQKLIDNNIEHKILIKDMEAYYSGRNLQADEPSGNSAKDYPVPDNFSLGSMGGYCTYDEMIGHLDNMASLFPDLICEKQIIPGFETHEGRPIYWLRISDNPNTNEDEPEILYTGVHHAREPISLQQLLFYMYYLLENYETDSEVQRIVNNTEMYFIPMVNPDGYIYNETSNPNGGGMWRKNRRDNGDGTYGVDLNRNYGYMWGYDNNGSSPNSYDDTYRGPSAFSEPELQAIKYFCEEHEFSIALNYHSYGTWFLYPWGYIDDHTPDHNIFLSYAIIMTSENSYTYGTAGELLYNTNGDANDWMYGEQETKNKIIAFTPEVGNSGDGFWPSQSRIIPLCQDCMLMNLMAASFTGAYVEMNNESPALCEQLQSYVKYAVQRLGMAESDNYTISIEALSDNVSSYGEAIVYNKLPAMEVLHDSIPFSLKSETQAGEEVMFLLSMDNGEYIKTDTIRMIYGSPINVFYDECNDLSLWETSSWDLSYSEYHSAESSITDSPSGSYGNNQNSSVTLSQEIDLSNSAFALLRFWAKWDIEADYDFVQVKISTNGGSSWQPMAGKYTEMASSYQPSGEPVYDGTQNEWVQEEILLDAFNGETIKLRFTLESDTYVTEDGFYFDDVEVLIVDVNTSNKMKLISSQAEIFPNPASNRIYIRFKEELKDSENIEFQLYNILGKQILVKPLPANENLLFIETGKLNNGMYFYQISDRENTIDQGKIMIKK